MSDEIVDALALDIDSLQVASASREQRAGVDEGRIGGRELDILLYRVDAAVLPSRGEGERRVRVEELGVPVKIPDVEFKVRKAGATSHVFVGAEHQPGIVIVRASIDRHQRQHECTRGEHPHCGVFWFHSKERKIIWILDFVPNFAHEKFRSGLCQLLQQLAINFT